LACPRGRRPGMVFTCHYTTQILTGLMPAPAQLQYLCDHGGCAYALPTGQPPQQSWWHVRTALAFTMPAEPQGPRDWARTLFTAAGPSFSQFYGAQVVTFQVQVQIDSLLAATFQYELAPESDDLSSVKLGKAGPRCREQGARPVARALRLCGHSECERRPHVPPRLLWRLASGECVRAAAVVTEILQLRRGRHQTGENLSKTIAREDQSWTSAPWTRQCRCSRTRENSLRPPKQLELGPVFSGFVSCMPAQSMHHGKRAALHADPSLAATADSPARTPRPDRMKTARTRRRRRRRNAGCVAGPPRGSAECCQLQAWYQGLQPELQRPARCGSV